MTPPDPPWKQKTRPCPFYSQGRCLFADSCNFVHEVKPPRPETSPCAPSISPLPSPPDSPVDMPASRKQSRRTSKVVRFCSPPRSPRMSSLLMALGDAITQEDPEEMQMQVEIIVNDEDEAEVDDADTIPSLAPIEDESHENIPISIVHTPVVVSDAPHSGAPDDHDVGPDPTGTPRSSLDQDSNTTLGDDEEITITQFPLPPVSHPTSSRPSSGLLSPIDLSASVPPMTFISPEYGASDLHREDSIDSGYASGIFIPPTFHASPPRSPRRLSTLSILSSPFGSPTKRLLGEENHPHAVSDFFSPAFSVVASQFEDADEIRTRYSDVDSRPPSAHGLSGEVDESEEDEDDAPESELVESPAEEAPSEDPLATVKARTLSPVDSPDHSRRPSVIIEGVSPIKDDTIHSFYDGYVERQASDDSHLSGSDEYSAPSSSVATPSTQEPSGTGAHVFTRPHVWTPSADSDSFGSPLRALFDERPPRVFSNPVKGKSPVRSNDPWAPMQLSPQPSSLRSSFSLSPLASPQPSPLPAEHDPDPPRSPAERDSTHGDAPEPQEHQAKWERRASTKVPLAWRQSLTGSVGRSPSLRQSGAARRRPPALTGLSPTSHEREWERGPSPSPLRTSVSAGASTAVELEKPLVVSPIQSAPSSVPGSSKLKPLRLSMILSAPASTAVSPMSPSFQVTSALDPSISIPPLTGTTAYTPHSPTVSSDYSLSNARLLSSRRSSLIPSGTRNTLLIDSTHVPSHDIPSHSAMLSPPAASPAMPISAPPAQAPPSWHTRKGSRSSVVSRRQSLIERFARPDSRASEPILYEEDEEDTLRVPRPVSSLAHTVPMSPVPPSPIHAIATPRPTLLFALASDNIDEVQRVLSSGEAGPNDDVGPQSALAFTLTARQLKHRQEMVKLLLAHGADPAAVKQIHPSRPASAAGSHEDSSEPLPDPLEELDHATKYYIKRAEAPQTRRASALIHRSFFRPLARVRYDLVGQDRALEQLFRVLSMPMTAPIVVLLCGPSGHGKSMLARKFGSLLEVPTHTVNMTTLRDTHDIWRSYSMSPYQEPSTCTLADFLIANEGRRCVVVLDEIEKSPNEKVLSSLLMPWELGRCSFEAGHRHVDVSQVIWLGTSNLGHDLVFEHQEKRQEPEAPMSREEYVDLMGLLRPCVSQRLGASLLSRVTTVLPFIPFTTEEKLAISAEALHSLTGEETELPPATIDMIVRNSLNAYIPAEGARSLYRAVSNLLLDTI